MVLYGDGTYLFGLIVPRGTFTCKGILKIFAGL